MSPKNRSNLIIIALMVVILFLASVIITRSNKTNDDSETVSGGAVVLVETNTRHGQSVQVERFKKAQKKEEGEVKKEEEVRTGKVAVMRMSLNPVVQ